MRFFLVDCVMGPWEDNQWSGWSSCETSCSARDGTGDQTRTRSPAINAANDGIECAEDTSEDQACTVECPGKKFVLQ